MPYVITEITQSKKNTERVNVYLNGAFWIGLSKNELIDRRLSKGQELSETEKSEIESTASHNKIIDRAIKYIQIHPRSSAEVRDYLVFRRGISAEEADKVITYLQEKELLSDEEFAKWYTAYKLESGVNGLTKIKAELQGKRVSSVVINEVLSTYSENEDFKNDQLVKIKEYAEKVMKTIKAKDAYDFKVKLTNRLLSRGFKYGEIKEVLKTLLS